jgi:hypothetical protein
MTIPRFLDGHRVELMLFLMINRAYRLPPLAQSQAFALCLEHRLDGGPFLIREFVAHGPRVSVWNHASANVPPRRLGLPMLLPNRTFQRNSKIDANGLAAKTH